MSNLGSLSSQDYTVAAEQPPPPDADDAISYDSSVGSLSEAESEDDNNENSLKKLENSINREFLLENHPEIKQINYEELEALSTVIRNAEGRIIDDLHKTMPFLTKYEKTRILGIRCKQINNGSQIFVDVRDDMIDGYNIAYKELLAKKIPFIIQRPLPNGACEYWKLRDLELFE